jgi:hypothetical protein
MKSLIVFPAFTFLLALAAFAGTPPDTIVAPSLRVPDVQPEEKAFMGIYAEMVSPEKARKMGLEHHYGTLVVGVIPNTGADKAGLQLFDYLYGVDAYRSGAGQTFGAILAKYKAGDKARLFFIRKGETRTADITFGVRPEQMEKKELNKCEDTFFGITPNESVAPDFVDGVKIDPLDNSTALDMGLQKGDVIKTLQGYRMYDWDDIGFVLDNMKVGAPLSATYERDGKTFKGTARLKSYAETKKCKDCDCSELQEKEFNIRIEIPDIDIELPDLPKAPAPPAPAPRPDVGGMQLDLQTAGEAEIAQLNSQFNLGMQSGNQLEVQNLQLSPDPNANNFQLTFKLPRKGKTLVRAFNNKGRLLYEFDLGPFTGLFSDAVDISQNGPGVYYLEIRQDNQALVKKIVLSKK